MSNFLFKMSSQYLQAHLHISGHHWGGDIRRHRRGSRGVHVLQEAIQDWLRDFCLAGIRLGALCLLLPAPPRPLPQHDPGRQGHHHHDHGLCLLLCEPAAGGGNDSGVGFFLLPTHLIYLIGLFHLIHLTQLIQGVGSLLLLDRPSAALVQHGQGGHLCHLKAGRWPRNWKDSLSGEHFKSWHF